MRNIILCLSLAFISCKATSYNFHDFVRNQVISAENQKARIDTLLANIFASEFTECNFYNYSAEYYNSKNMLPYKDLDELWLLHDTSLDNEKYIFQKILRNYNYQNTENKKNWYNCLMLFPKKDCADGDIVHRMHKLPHILKDSTNLANTIRALDHIADILQEDCSVTQRHIEKDLAWREAIYEAAIIHIPNLKKYEPEYVEDVHWLLDKLPIHLSTNYAYEYTMKHELSGEYLELPDYILDIIDSRSIDRGYYSGYDGPSIFLTAEQIKNLIKKVSETRAAKDCDWCDSFIKRMTYAYNENVKKKQ